MFTIKLFLDEIQRRHLTPQLVEIAERGGQPAYECGRGGGCFRTIMAALFPEWEQFTAPELSTAKQVWGKAVAAAVREWGWVPESESPTPLSKSTDPREIKNAHKYRRI